MLNLAQALSRRGAAGLPLPIVYQSLHDAGCDICRSCLTLVVGPASSGKSAFSFNLVARLGVPTLAFLLDTNELTAACRFLAIITGQPFNYVKEQIEAGNEKQYADLLNQAYPHIQVSFHAPDPATVEREIMAYEQRYGVPPTVVLIDNLGNQASAYENEWSMLRSLTLELDRIAKEAQCAVIGCAHTTDLITTEPARRDKIMGKVSQFARVILSVGFNAYTHEFKVAVLKASEGPSDPGAEWPITFWADMARMKIEERKWWNDPPPRVPDGMITGQRLPYKDD